MLRLIIASLFGVVLSGCTPIQHQTVQLQPFDPSKYLDYRNTGDGIITGQAFLRQNGGGVVTCAGSSVLLIPNMPFFREWLSAIAFKNNPSISPSDMAEMKSVIKEAHCDAQGNFSFYNLSSANWIIMAKVNWEVSRRKQGGELASLVKSTDGQTISIILSTKINDDFFKINTPSIY